MAGWSTNSKVSCEIIFLAVAVKNKKNISMLLKPLLKLCLAYFDENNMLSRRTILFL